MGPGKLRCTSLLVSFHFHTFRMSAARAVLLLCLLGLSWLLTTHTPSHNIQTRNSRVLLTLAPVMSRSMIQIVHKLFGSYSFHKRPVS
jgi:hypothetical protein